MSDPLFYLINKKSILLYLNYVFSVINLFYHYYCYCHYCMLSNISLSWIQIYIIVLLYALRWSKRHRKTWNLFHGWTAIHEINFKFVFFFFCISCIIITKSKIHKFRYMKYKTNLRWTTLIFYIYVSIHYFLTKGICSKNVRQKLKVSLYGPEARLQLVFNILFEIIKFSIIGK